MKNKAIILSVSSYDKVDKTTGEVVKKLLVKYGFNLNGNYELMTTSFDYNSSLEKEMISLISKVNDYEFEAYAYNGSISYNLLP